MKITHNNKTYIDAATHAGLRCWLDTVWVNNNEAHSCYLAAGDYAQGVLELYLVDPDGMNLEATEVLITDAEDHRKHWPMRNTHRHPLEDVGEKIELLEFRGEPIFKDDFFTVGKWSDLSDAPTDNKILRADGFAEATEPAPQPVDGEWPRWGLNTWEIYRFDAEDRGVFYGRSGASGPCQLHSTWTDRVARNGKGTITPTQAAEWLRNNGHEAVAAEIEGDRFEPVGCDVLVGDVVYREGAGYAPITRIDRSGTWCSLGTVAEPAYWSGKTAKYNRILKRRAAK